MNVGQEDQKTCQFLAATRDAELGGLLNRSDRIAAGTGECDDLGAAALGSMAKCGR
jgi:hypothetical protein